MAPPTHPLRRISTGSLTSLARSQDHATHSSSGLDFLQPALTDLADEAATLASNIQRMTRLHDALGTFNEAFAAYLYAMKMNAFCVEWAEVGRSGHEDCATEGGADEREPAGADRDVVRESSDSRP